MTPAGYQPKITVVDPDPEWRAEFAAEAADIRAVLGDAALRVEHHGSTSVPDLAAKPIIDIQVSVAAVEVAELEDRLGRIGYVRVPWPGDADDYPFFAKPAEGFRTHHIHACRVGSLEEHRHLAVRDYLCAHPDEAATYGALKRDLAERYDGDRQAYVDGKDAYVKALEARALAWAPPAP